MEADPVVATIGVLVQNLIDVSKEEISLHRGLDNNAEKLRRINFGLIQGYLADAHKKFITDDAVKGWLKELEVVAFDADNVLDEYNYKLLSKKMKNIRTFKEKVVGASCFPSFSYCVRRRHLAVRINGIITTFDEMIEKAGGLGLERRLAAAPAAAVPDTAYETDSVTVDPVFTGRDGDVSEIVKKLTTPTQEPLSILPIVGMGGLGKTTLVRKVFNHGNIISYFGMHIWVHVSQKFDAMLIFKKILKEIIPGNYEVQSREDLLKKLREALAGKTYVLVLDDVWNEEQEKWEGFINSWSGITSTKGNGILVTTRSTEVGSIVNTVGIHHLNGLSEEECFSIINVRAGDIPSGIEDIGRSIAERCKGLPLAANVVGGVLRHKSQEEWVSIRDNWLSNVGGDENMISRILKLSFHHLPSPSLKKCFAYCSVFPKGASIKKKQLIEHWMAEGFLTIEQENDMETVGNKLFDHLVKSSLLQVVKRDEYNKVKRCSMHDLVHDVAGSVLGLAKVNENTSNQARYISWQSDGDESSRIPKEQAKWLRTLFYKGDISDIKFSDFKSLRELTLTLDEDVVELPDSIKELIHLRYLNIFNTSVTSLPDSTGELYHLQTFWAPYSGSLQKWPSTFKYLFKLRHLHLLDRDTKLPPQLGKLTSLQTLSYFKVRDEEGHRISELGSLKNLKGELDIFNLYKVQGEEDSKKAYLLQKSGIQRLVLRWDEYGREGEVNDENVLRGLQPHPNLKFLEIKGFKGASFPLWTLKMEGLNNLMEISLERCSECEEIPSLGHLPHLKSLYLVGLKKVKSIGSSFYNFFKETLIINVFPALERLVLRDMTNLMEWGEVEIPSDAQVKVFQRLQYLEIYNCNNLRSAPQSEFPCLEHLKIDGVDPAGTALANICGIKLKSLVNLEIEELGEMVCLPDWLFHNNQNLSVLKIMDCPKLRTLPDGLQTLTCLKELEIRNCKNLMLIPYSNEQQSTLMLRELSIGNTRGEIPIPFPCEMIESCAPSLEVLKLYDGSGINISMIMGCAHKMRCLTRLEMYNVPKFIITTSSPKELGSLPNLNRLILICDNSGAGSWDCVSFNEAANGILRLGCQSLRELNLKGSEDWESLPEEIQHLTALERLRVKGFGIQELPEWFGNLLSLRDLSLVECRKLKHLASVEAMRRLTNLYILKIDKCPLLEERCKQQQSGDSECPKISHIPNLVIHSRLPW